MSGVAPAPPPAAPDDRYAHAWAPFEQDPGPLVFLLGCQRSGTTWLHLQLARTGCFRFLSAYDVYAGDALVQHARTGVAEVERRAFDARLGGRTRDRAIDAIPAGADTPEEYGLVIGDGTLRYDHPDTTERTVPRLRTLCAKKALLEGRDRPLLLKSPPDYPRGLPLLARTWPEARFLAIHRHPLPTLSSQVRAWRELLLRPNPYLAAIDRGYAALLQDPGGRMRMGMLLHSPAGVERLADAILKAHLGFLAVTEGWSADRLLSIRYEDLCADPHVSHARLSSFLQRPLPDPCERPAPRELPLPEGVREAFARRLPAFAPYLERFGYAADG